MNTEFYKTMKNELRTRECSIRTLAGICDLHSATLIDFFSDNTPMRPLRQSTMGKIHNHLGIPYEVMEEYNEVVLKERANKERSE